MEIDFKNKKIRNVCEQKSSAKSKRGSPLAKKIERRMADLKAADSVNDLVAGNPHPLKGDRAGQFALRLHGGKRLVFEPNHHPIARLKDGSIDWSNVTKVLIVEIVDYHD
jgi:proteic killer suppression protein